MPDSTRLARDRAPGGRVAVVGAAPALALSAALIAAVLLGNGRTALWDQDEAAYAGFSLRMHDGGSWAVPDYFYSKAHRKPPLCFWLIAGSYRVFGVNEFAVRFPTALAVIGAAALVAFRGGFLFGRPVARLGGLVLLSMLFVAAMGKIALTDGVLLFFQTAAALALLRNMVKPSLATTIGLWVSVALGVLTKGPPILILVAAMHLALLVLHPRRGRLVHTHPWFGLPLALVPAGVWLAQAWAEDPRFVFFLAEWYIFKRVGGGVFGQLGPPGLHFALMFLLIVPWTAYLLPALRDVLIGVRRRRWSMLLAAAWLAGGWIVWEIPLSKLPTYALGAYPAVALLIARWLAREARQPGRHAGGATLRHGFNLSVGVAVVYAFAIVAATGWIASIPAAAAALAPGATLVLGVWLARGLHLAGRTRPAATVLLAAAPLALASFWMIVIAAWEPARAATRRVADRVAAAAPRGAAVHAAARMSNASLPFYVEQRGLRYHEIPPPLAPAPLRVNWALLRDGGVRAFRDDLIAQTPKRASEAAAEDASKRILELLASTTPAVLILDGEQHARHAAAIDESGARVDVILGFQIDKGDWRAYAVVQNAAGVEASARP